MLNAEKAKQASNAAFEKRELARIEKRVRAACRKGFCGIKLSAFLVKQWRKPLEAAGYQIGDERNGECNLFW